MVIKALYYFIGLFFIFIIILLTQEPYSLELKGEDEQKPIIEFFNVNDFNIDEDGIKMSIKADTVRRYSDKDILHNIDAYMQKNSILETLSANTATILGKTIYFTGDVMYTRDSTFSLATQEAEYHQENQTIIGKAPFELKDVRVHAFGDNFIYDTKAGKIDASNVKTDIEMR